MSGFLTDEIGAIPENRRFLGLVGFSYTSFFQWMHQRIVLRYNRLYHKGLHVKTIIYFALVCFLQQGMTRMRRFALLLGIVAFVAVRPASAVPLLSMDIAGGTYDSGSSSIIAGNNPFTLYALFNSQQGSVAGTYYLAAAIIPKTENPPVANFGSFSINGVNYSVGNMIYGNPPASVLDNSLKLQNPAIYDTHYVEIAFTFDTSQRANLYDSKNNPGGLQPNSSGDMIYEDFTVDVSGLAAGYAVHLDLYSVGTDIHGSPTVTDSAPSIYAAQSGVLTVGDTSSTMMLLGMAMLAVEGLRRRFLR